MSIATLKSDLSLHNLTFEDAIELALCVSAKSANAVETIGSKRSYALTWCMPNNDDDECQKLNRRHWVARGRQEMQIENKMF